MVDISGQDLFRKRECHDQLFCILSSYRPFVCSLYHAFLKGNDIPMKKTPKTLKTPPYVIARPEVTHRRLTPPSEGSMRFLVLATDGLWDVLRYEAQDLIHQSFSEHLPP